MSISGSKAKRPDLPALPPAPAQTPTRADSSVDFAGESTPRLGASSLIFTGSQGLTTQARTKKRSLIGGAQ